LSSEGFTGARHPINLGLFIVSGAFTLLYLMLPVILVFSLLLLVTNIRADLEDGMLEKILAAFAAYQNHTRRFIPFICWYIGIPAA